MVFTSAFKSDRHDLSTFEDIKHQNNFEYDLCTGKAYANDVMNDEEYTIHHDISIPKIPTLSVGSPVRYLKDDHVEVGILIGADFSDPSSPTVFEVEFKDGRKIETTREHIELEETPDSFAIPTNAQNILEVASTISKQQLQSLLNPEILTPLQQLWLWWHEVLDHLPRSAMNRLVEKGSLPAKFKALKDWKFVCPSCLLAVQKKTSWRTKAKPSSIRKDIVKAPGDLVCIDHIISAQPGLLPRISGHHTRERISAACVFKDCYSGFTYVHLMTSCDLEQTINAKVSFEKLASTYGVSVKQYHADNGHFACKGFRDAVTASNQKITFCGVGAHHQNGIVENMIGLLTRWSRISLLHAKRRWPQAITTILWPYALKSACARYNQLHLDADGCSPESKFASVDSAPVVSNKHPWGCPVFVLNEKAQNGKSPKWEPRSRVAIYLGHSPTHAGSVAMVLNPRTLHVSPQYHVVFDDNFSTVSSMVNGEVPDNWLDLVKQSEEHTDDVGSELTRLWASREFDPFHDSDDDDTTSSENEYANTPVQANTTTEKEQLIPQYPPMKK